MMNKYGLLLTGVIVVVTGMSHFSHSAAAETKHVLYDWNKRHWETLDFKPYVENYGQTHLPMQRYQAFPFSSDVSPNEAINGFRASKLLHKFYIDKKSGHSVAEVGPYFYDLSQSDKGHFVASVDRAYNVVDSDQQILFLIDWNTKRSIGQYSQNGLMLF